MQQALQHVEKKDIIMFALTQPEFLEDTDMNQASKELVSLSKHVIFGSIAGVFINVQVKRVPYINFLTWVRPIRYVSRIALFSIP